MEGVAGPSRGPGGGLGKGIIPHYFASRQCPICLEKEQTVQSSPICSQCRKDPGLVADKLSHWIGIWDRRLRDLDQACRGCQIRFDICRSLDCPRLYLRTEAKFDAEQVEVGHQMLTELSF